MVTLTLMTPTTIVEKRMISKISAEAEDGAFCLLPRHVDFVAGLVPGIFTYADSNGKEHVLALDQGILVKKGNDVFVSTRALFTGEEIGTLEKKIYQEFYDIDEQEKKMRSQLAKLESDISRRLREMNTV